MYKLVIFDFDGTLADSAGWLTGELRPLARRFGFRQVSDDEIAMLRGRCNREILRYLQAPAWKLPALAAHVRKRFSQDAESMQLFPGAKALLRRLAGDGVILGVVSSNSEANVKRVLGPEVAALIGHYQCGASIFGKAARFKRLVKRARVTPCQALCVGDEAGDIEAAKAAGLASAAVASGYATRELLAAREPTWMFESLDACAAKLAA